MLPTRKSNLDVFLERSSPRIPIQFHTERSEASSSVGAAEEVRKPHIVLGDIWSNLEQWSSYGVQIPLYIEQMFDSEVKHHYVPYLSAIQIFTKQPFADNGDLASRSSVTGSDGAGPSSVNPNPNCGYGHHFLTPENLGYLYFQYSETTKPHERPPLFDMMTELAEQYSGLTTLTSSDLTQYSWISIAWYPIYPIPAVKCAKDVNASFLTYHSLTPTFPETLVEGQMVVNEIGQTRAPEVVLPPFASVTYKTFGDLWIRPGTPDRQKAERCEESATSWVNTLGFRHDDLIFFMSRKFYTRSC